jgi:hypothetical protein
MIFLLIYLMKDPIKIIHKFKNNYNRIQYKIYIFIGSLVPDNIKKILYSIQSKDLYTTFNELLLEDYSALEEYYGEKWYEKFFLSYHIDSQRKNIINIPDNEGSLIKKYGKKWYDRHILKPDVIKPIYSFESVWNYYSNMKHKIKNIKQEYIDFRTNNKSYLTGGNFTGGKKSNDDDDDDDGDDEEDFEALDDIVYNEEEITETVDRKESDEIQDDINLQLISEMYSDKNLESTKVIKQTSELISKAIKDESYLKKIQELELEYDSSLDNISHDTNIEDVYNKYYIHKQYIFKDDNIKTLRNKISVSIPISPKFGEGIKLLPETQYLWSSYKLNNSIDSIMIGQKWIIRNELLKIDIIPNENLKIYEKLRNNLSTLRDYFGYRIRREDDDTVWLRLYENYLNRNEIYLLDIYNELGMNYNPTMEEKRNIFEVYIYIYFPMISTYERFDQIIQLLNNISTKELDYIDNQFIIIKNDTTLESEIENVVEIAKINNDAYNHLFLNNNIIQAIIHVNIQNENNITGTVSASKLNLFRIFDNFILNEKYPFIQYQTDKTNIIYKFNSDIIKTNNKDTLIKWFEIAINGISFKIIKDQQKYYTINLYDTGKIEYKLTWKEDENATLETIYETFDDIRDLLKKINSENKKIKINIPSNDKFKYAFINCMLSFTLPDKFIINHNDLSEFSRYFYNYVAVVIEPKKRQTSKKETVKLSKYGTYLRYKRINKYDNRTKIHMRIIELLKNYDISNKDLIDEIAKEFNITMEFSAKEIDYVRDIFANLIKKRSAKLLKKPKSAIRSKLHGISIDIQGKDRTNYKVRLTGIKSKEQLDEIVGFTKALIYMYIETYIYKNKEYQIIKDKLKNLTKIAKRRHKVADLVEYVPNVNNIKQVAQLDKERLGFKPEKGQSGWSRFCQNYGKIKKRPKVIPEDEKTTLLSSGYKLNEKTGYYEKLVKINNKSGESKTLIKAIKLSNNNNTYNFFTCDPKENNEFIHIGFLTKANTPSNLCIPCCFKKDQYSSNNKFKRDFFSKCLNDTRDETTHLNITIDKIYILYDSIKLQENKFIHLDEQLDIFFNKINNKKYIIKNNYFKESSTGYYFKYTSHHSSHHFLVVISSIFNIQIKEIIDKMVEFLEKDKYDKCFTYLNNGDICTTFGSKDKYIDYIKTSSYLDYNSIGELVSMPGIISKNGLHIYIIIKTKLYDNLSGSNTINYHIDCLNTENNNFLNSNKNRDIIILINDTKYYHPIFRIHKENKHQDMKIIKTYNYDDDISKELRVYYSNSCNKSFTQSITSNYFLSAKTIIEILKEKNITVNEQFIDEKNKCRYILLNNGLLIPTSPSGINYNYSFTNIKKIYHKVKSLKDTINLLKDIEKLLNFDYKPYAVYYNSINKYDINIVSILLKNKLHIPIIEEECKEKNIKKLNIITIYQSLQETIDKYIQSDNMQLTYDKQTKEVKEHSYLSESYNLFRLEISYFLSKDTDKRDLIKTIVNDKTILKPKKRERLSKILYKIIEDKTNVNIIDTLPNLEKYKIKNIRDYCKIHKNKDECNTNMHCKWIENKNENKNESECKFILLKSNIGEFINLLIEELLYAGIKYKEIIQEGDYYVSDIVNLAEYTYRNKQQIIKDTNINVQKLLEELFGLDKLPTIGARHVGRVKRSKDSTLYSEPMIIGDKYIQEIIPNNDSIIRAYVNSFYWISNPLYNSNIRNLGYINELQTMITYLLKANIIDYIQRILEGEDSITDREFIYKYFKYDDNFFESALNKFKKSIYNSDGIIELYVLSQLIHIPIVVYNEDYKIKYILLQGYVEIDKDVIKKFTSHDQRLNTIFLQFNYEKNNIIPNKIYSIYYI